MEDDTDDFAAVLSHAASTVEHWPQDAIKVAIQGQPHPLSRQVSGSLLMLMQESTGNAFKHGAVTRVRVTIIYGAESLEMRVQDNGSGFVPHDVPEPQDGHFGLESARLRLRRLKGTLVVREGLEAMLGVDRSFESITTAASAVEALQLCAEFHPDVVLLDLRMPEVDGGNVFPDKLPSSPSEIPALSLREWEVLRHLGRGLSSYELGLALGISSETVKSHIKSIFHKLSVTNRAEAVSRAFEIGLLAVERQK